MAFRTLHAKWVGLVAAVLIALSAGYLMWLAPESAMKHLRDASTRGDIAELSKWIDLESIKRSAKKQARVESRAIAARNRRELEKLWKNRTDPAIKHRDFSFKKDEIESAVAYCHIDETIDEWLTTEDIGGMILNGRPGLPITKGSTNEPHHKSAQDWKIARLGFAEFRAGMSGEIPIILVFKRDGLQWKMKDILMPKGGFAPWSTVEPPAEGWAKDFKPRQCI